MKNISKRIVLILFILMLLFSINSRVYAFGEIIQDGKAFIRSADPSKIDQQAVQTGLQDISGFLYNILLSAGVVIAVIVATVLGIQFMVGGAEGQAKVKEMLIPFVVGCVVVFGAFGIWKIALTIGQRLEGPSTGAQGTSITSSDSTGSTTYIDEGIEKTSSDYQFIKIGE